MEITNFNGFSLKFSAWSEFFKFIRIPAKFIILSEKFKNFHKKLCQICVNFEMLLGFPGSRGGVRSAPGQRKV